MRRRDEVFSDGDRRETRTVEGAAAGPPKPERAYGGAASDGGAWRDRRIESAWYS
jgi:hypothetical protein